MIDQSRPSRAPRDMSMPALTYSVYFTGIWLNEAGAASRMELLRRLFPDADAGRLEHFLDHRRVLLIHGASLEAAKRIVMTLYEHGLECDIAEDAEVAPDVHAVMSAPATPARPAEPEPSVPPAAAAPLPAADEFTPRGRRILRGLIVVTAVLVIAASGAAWRRLQLGANATTADMPSVCATDTRTSWYGKTTSEVLLCAARTATGERYRLTLSCAPDGSVTALLATFDATGAARAPRWASADGRMQRLIRYRSGDAGGQSLTLQRTDAAHVGALPQIDAPAAARMLAAESLELSDIFEGESVRFDLESARWYLDYFSGTCGLAHPPP